MDMASAPKRSVLVTDRVGTRGSDMQGRGARTPCSSKQEPAVRLPTEATLNAFSQHTTRGCERLISIPTLVRLLPKACAESNKSILNIGGLAVSSSVLEPYGSCQPQRSERTLRPSDLAVNSGRVFIYMAPLVWLSSFYQTHAVTSACTLK